MIAMAKRKLVKNKKVVKKSKIKKVVNAKKVKKSIHKVTLKKITKPWIGPHLSRQFVS
jgi:hypothetical protein